MLIRGVVDHQIHHDLDAIGMRLSEQGIHIIKSAEHRIDVAVIRDVISVIILR